MHSPSASINHTPNRLLSPSPLRGEGLTRALFCATLLTLTACDTSGFPPRDKTASYDPVTSNLVLPHPCPDWSQPQTQNYANENHSNYGCAVNTNTALQLAYPEDLIQGHGSSAPDTSITTRVIERYRLGELPATLTPTQGSGTTE